jgi:hypothetical protein
MSQSTGSPPATTDPPAPPPPRPDTTPRRLFVPALYLLRVLATLNALLVIAQAWSIGQYLNGDYAQLRLHATGAGIAILTAAALGLAAVLYAFAGGSWWAVAAVLLFLAEGFQTGMGYARQLGIHVPLGVAVVTLAVLVAVWSWTRAAARPRARSVR